MLTKLKFSTLALGFALFNTSAGMLVSARPELPRVLIIASGGTIADEQGEPGTLGGYDIRKPINEIVAEVPEARKFAQIETVQFANIPSAYITPDQWLQLARTINSAFDKHPE